MQNYLRIISRNDYFRLFLLYCISNIWILLNDGIFWDDWVWFNNPVEIMAGMNELGLGTGGEFLKLLYSNVFSIKFSKTIVFLLYLGTGFVFRKILDVFDFFSEKDKFFLSAIFLIAPLNIAKNTLCVSNNALNYFLFFCGCFIALRNQLIGSLILTLVASSLLFLSYYTNSLLLFTLILYCALFFNLIEANRGYEQGLLKKFLKKNYVYLLLPIFFWVTKIIFLKPTGMYYGYNSFQLHKPFFIFKGLTKAFSGIFLSPISYTLPAIPKVIIELTIGFLFLFFVIKISKSRNANRKSFYAVVFGTLSVMAATLPYLVVGKVGTFSAYNSRHQLLLPLGVAFIIYYGINILVLSDRQKSRLLNLLFVFLTFINFKTGMDFQGAHFKQLSLMQEFKTNHLYQINQVFIFDSGPEGLSDIFPKPSFYAYTGMFYEVFKDQKRIGASSLTRLNQAYEAVPEKYLSRYKMKGISKNPPQLLVHVSDAIPLDSFVIFNMLIDQLLNFPFRPILSFKYSKL